jgi:hypothetical protein
VSREHEPAAALRTAFDRGFADAPAGATVATTAFLAIRAGEQARAVRLTEVAGLFADRRIVPLPTRAPALLGLAGFRGAVLPVYDLRLLIGAAGTAAPRWLLIAAAAPVVFGFDAFEGHLAVPHDTIAGRGGTEVVTAGGVSRAVIALATLIQQLTRET